MRWIEVTKTNSGRYDGPMLLDADKLLAVQRVTDGRGSYTLLFMAVPDTSTDEHGNAPGGFAGFDVHETPDEVMALLDGASAPEPLHQAV